MMDNNLCTKQNNSLCPMYLIGNYGYLGNSGTEYASVANTNTDCWVIVSAYEYNNVDMTESNRAVLTINGTSVPRLTNSSSEGHVANTCFISKIPSGATAKLRLTYYWNASYAYIFTSSKPTLIGSIITESGNTRTLKITSNKNLLICVLGKGTTYSLATSKPYYTVNSQSYNNDTYLREIFLPAQSGRTTTISVTSIGCISVYEF